MKDWKDKLKQLEQVKYPLLVLVIGVLLMLLPGGFSSPKSDAEAAETFPSLVSRIDGVGKSCLALSEEGVVIVCEGAEDPQVQLALLKAVRAYTGFSSDRITILKMAD